MEEPQSSSSPTTSPITASLLTTIHAYDQAIYPSALPLSQLRAWVAACPELSIADAGRPSPPDEVQGVIIVLPLRRGYWEDLLVGRVAEGGVEVGMFPPPCHGGSGEGEDEVVEVGLHVYHVERFGENRRGGGFTERALEEVRRRVTAVWPGWRVVGVSALIATDAGSRTFARLGLQKTGYREVFVQRGPPQDGADQQGVVDMVCCFPGDEAGLEEIVGQGVVVSTSEMVVRYET
ncbi:hypothetical protein C8A05DRAFT_13268 [Staphylotrichum tortipilum]|uniref:Uncharacterized protein n=1 Tax=Staphylotrichum tortipilum TaxID=2831512 RepID=A0AAN6RW27_9PEZI|nr:hypothetical protein C8A05DRAFT_13268 [Staphylotrichum longicolle]